MIFPEGTRSRSKHPPHLSKGKTGVARLAARFPEVPVVPMAILGARKFMAILRQQSSTSGESAGKYR